MRLDIVVPCYNEEDVLEETARRLEEILEALMLKGKIDAGSRICFVDDGSHDASWAIIERLAARTGWVRGLKLSRNRGHQNALLAGLLACRGDAAISLDADLQDDPLVIEQMVDAYRAGYDVAYGVRSDRQSDKGFKRVSAALYYRLLGALGIDVVANHADFRLLSRRALQSLGRFREANLFLRGIVPLIGYPSTCVYYSRGTRLAGRSKYPVSNMLLLALEGITAFTAAPLRLITLLGVLVSLASGLLTIWALWTKLFGQAVPGWASTVVPLYFLGGIQLLSIGIIGEYLARVYAEVKGRPRYFIEKTVPESAAVSESHETDGAAASPKSAGSGRRAD
jgi:glycosyltransferase involved in cell wall biosynthesis